MTTTTLLPAPHPVRGRLNAAFFRLVDGAVHRLLGERKAALFADLPATLVELGAGTGANMRYYAPGTRVIAIEPNPSMHGPLRASAARYGIDLEIRAVGAEDTGLPDGCVDAVVSTLVLCTVVDPAAALAEARRVLRPGGRLIVLEHVAAPEGSALARVQRALWSGWRWAFEGCDLQRHTGELLTAAGFADVALEHYRGGSTVFLPVDQQVAGTLTR
ncbi:class I SAM-dependent methyltransferase [Actinomycetospora chlora]|uniref:Class I SAM-dependent methyltransferase n=1 Tax=Actinomycetospora chlora TaxID=663608 RepID=A0ABP9A3K9_9PSEU